MTLQQMEYIIALEKYGHFVLAAEACGVTQPTLSAMIQKLEEELNVQIFNRAKHPIEPTHIGKKIIRQAQIAINETNNIKNLIADEMYSLSGNLQLGVIPTIAPYIVPDFISNVQQDYPHLSFSISEMRTKILLEHIRLGDIDIGIATTPLYNTDFLEIPIYYERFVAYFAANNIQKDIPLTPTNMPMEGLWILQEGHCVRNQVFNFCERLRTSHQMYEAGSIDTLVKIVDKNGGYTIIPEMHIPYLTPAQNENIRQIDFPPAVREISLVIKPDYVRERIVNAVADTLKKIIPQKMQDERLQKFAIKL